MLVWWYGVKRWEKGCTGGQTGWCVAEWVVNGRLNGVHQYMNGANGLLNRRLNGNWVSSLKWWGLILGNLIRDKWVANWQG